jgi:hypothetical protein
MRALRDRIERPPIPHTGFEEEVPVLRNPPPVAIVVDEGAANDDGAPLREEIRFLRRDHGFGSPRKRSASSKRRVFSPPRTTSTSGRGCDRPVTPVVLGRDLAPSELVGADVWKSTVPTCGARTSVAARGMKIISTSLTSAAAEACLLWRHQPQLKRAYRLNRPKVAGVCVQPSM